MRWDPRRRLRKWRRRNAPYDPLAPTSFGGIDPLTNESWSAIDHRSPGAAFHASIPQPEAKMTGDGVPPRAGSITATCGILGIPDGRYLINAVTVNADRWEARMTWLGPIEGA